LADRLSGRFRFQGTQGTILGTICRVPHPEEADLTVHHGLWSKAMRRAPQPLSALLVGLAFVVGVCLVSIAAGQKPVLEPLLAGPSEVFERLMTLASVSGQDDPDPGVAPVLSAPLSHGGR
jgi:hypothetical protein